MKFNKLIPELSVSDINKSLKFYVDVFGFKVEYERKENKFAFISLQGTQLMIEEVNNTWSIGKLEKPFGRGINFQIEAEKIQPLLDSLKKHKYPLFKEPKENWYRKGDILLGNREFLVQDPDGYLLRFCENIGKKSIKLLKQ